MLVKAQMGGSHQMGIDKMQCIQGVSHDVQRNVQFEINMRQVQSRMNSNELATELTLRCETSGAGRDRACWVLASGCTQATQAAVMEEPTLLPCVWQTASGLYRNAGHATLADFCRAVCMGGAKDALSEAHGCSAEACLLMLGGWGKG